MIQMDGGDRLRVTLLARMSTVETSRSSLTGITLEGILMADKNGTSPQPPLRNQSNRTLLDIMQREHRHDDHHNRNDKTAWKTLREKLRLKRNATVWISSNSIPSLNRPILNRANENHHQLGFLLSNSGNVTEEEGSGAEGRLRLGAVLAEERALSAREEEMPPPPEPVMGMQPARMSLMELLEENEGQMSLVGVVEGEEEEKVIDGGGGGGGGGAAAAAAEISCCVCMVRSKGAAFIPCGHTFCRLCSRELWVQRGNCPLCNTSILEILDLF